MTGRIQSSSQRCYFGEKNWEMLGVCCQWGTIMRVCGSLSVQEQEFPCKMSGKQREGDGGGSGGSLTPLCLHDCREKGTGRRTGGGPKLSRTKRWPHGLFVLLLASHRCIKLCWSSLPTPPPPKICQNLAISEKSCPLFRCSDTFRNLVLCAHVTNITSEYSSDGCGSYFTLRWHSRSHFGMATISGLGWSNPHCPVRNTVTTKVTEMQ